MGIDGDLDDIAQVELRALHSRVCKANLGHRVFHIFHNLFFCINRIVAALAVNDHLHIVRFPEMVLTCRKKGILDGLQQCVFADVIFLFQHRHCFHQFLVHLLSSF